jgi:hypothetical protein
MKRDKTVRHSRHHNDQADRKTKSSAASSGLSNPLDYSEKYMTRARKNEQVVQAHTGSVSWQVTSRTSVAQAAESRAGFAMQ